MGSRLGSRAVLVALAALGCTRGGWIAAVEARHPGLRALEPHHLGSTRPYVLPLSGMLTRLLCRWPTGAPIPLSGPAGASPEQRRAIAAAAAAWEGAGLGVRFGPPAPGRVGIEISLRDDLVASQASTIADCAVEAAGLAGGGEVLPAQIVYASIHLSRHDIRMAGTALHELGHALGFQGHVRRGRTAMLGSSREVWKLGREVLAGRGFEDPALRALYALPSGLVVERSPVGAELTEPADRLWAIARQRGFPGPWLRVGDREGLLYWRDERGARIRIRIEGLAGSLSDPRALRLVPGSRAARLLEADASGGVP